MRVPIEPQTHTGELLDPNFPYKPDKYEWHRFCYQNEVSAHSKGI
jgi:hypothetical protein